MIISGLFWVQFDGFAIIFEGLFYRADVSVHTGQIVIRRRIFGIEGERFLPLLLGALLIMNVIQKCSVGQQRPYVVGMLLQKILVSQADRFEAGLDPAVEFRA